MAGRFLVCIGLRGSNMLGYMTKKEALKHGFTHHGKIFGVPAWVVEKDGFMLAAKWAPMELFITACHVVESMLYATVWSDQEPTFKILIGDQIK